MRGVRVYDGERIPNAREYQHANSAYVTPTGDLVVNDKTNQRVYAVYAVGRWSRAEYYENNS